MIELLTALKTAWSGALTTNCGKFFLGVSAPGEVFPYTVATTIAAPAEASYGKAVAYSEPEIQFAVYHTSAAAAATAITYLTTTLDADTFSLVGSRKKFSFTRLGDPVLVPEAIDAQDESGGYVYGWIVSYRYAVSN